MPGTNDSSRYSSGRNAARFAVWAAVLAAIICTLLVLVGTSTREDAPVFLAAGAIGFIVTIVGVGVGLAIAEQGGGHSDHLAEQVRNLGRAVSELREQQALSEDARRVINRRRDREVLRAAIEEDIAGEHWDAAMVLVEELANRFGYRADAEEFRARIEQARYDTVQRRVADAMQKVDELLVQRRWDQAMAEALRLRRIYPESPQAQMVRERVENARAIYKADLERRFLQCAEQSRVDEAMTLLKELDGYLTEAEAGPYREVARGVIGKARENLGARFKLAVQDRRWEEASHVGHQIIEQFPNTRMAEEVRALMDTIRARSRPMSVN